MIRIGATVAGLLSLAVAVLLIDLFLFPGIVLPAIVYAVPIILSAFLLPPALVAAVSVAAVTLQGIDAWLESAPLWLFSLDVLGIATFGYLATMLSMRSRRESELTARARAAATQAREQRERLGTILQQMPAGVVIAESPSGMLEFASARTGQIWRREFREGMSIEQYADLGLFHADGRPYDRDEVPLVRSLFDGEVVTGEEIRISRGDGTWGVVRANSAPIRDAAGRTVAAVVAFDDITELKQVEEEREHLLVEVQRRVAELNATITSVADGLLVYSPAAEIVQMNDTAARILGYSKGQRELSLKERLMLLHAETPDGKPVSVQQFPVERALNGETTRGTVIVLHPPGGETRWVSVSAAPILAARGKLLGAVATFTDITPIHELQERREDDLRMISHDLRTPLTPIMGQASLLQRLLADRGLPREAGSAETIVKNARRMNSMIQELVESARLEAGGLELHEESTDLCDLARDISERIGTSEDRARLRVECTSRLPEVPTDRDRMERVVSNLITNALKYSAPDTPVMIKAERDDGEVTVSVSDQGIGIPPDELPHVFDRFYRARAGRKTEGLGLGLYISRMIVEAHGGRLWAESEVGHGSTFTVSLPISRRS